MSDSDQVCNRLAIITDPAELEQFQKFWGTVLDAHQDNTLSIGDAYRLKGLLYQERFEFLSLADRHEWRITELGGRCDAYRNLTRALDDLLVANLSGKRNTWKQVERVDRARDALPEARP